MDDSHPVDIDLEWVKRGRWISAVADLLGERYGTKTEIDRLTDGVVSTIKIAGKTVFIDESALAGPLNGKNIRFEESAKLAMTTGRLLQLDETGMLNIP